MENYFQKNAACGKRGGGGISADFLKNRPSPPLISTSHNLQFPCSFAFCCLITFIAVQHTTNNKKHAHKANKRFILAREHWEQKKNRQDNYNLICSYHDK